MDAEGILAGLNSDQRAAVLHDFEKGAQLLVLAGAGSGKTSVLTKRIQYRILSGEPPEKILALTFTAKAAAEMRERVQALFPNAGVRLCTFHSLALFMLRQVIGGSLAYELLGFKVPPTPRDAPDRDFLAKLSKLHVKSFSREDLFSDSVPASVAAKLEGLRAEVLESGQVVFDDLIYLAIRLLATNEEACAFFREMWEDIMVDEYQDINPPQYRMVRLLLGDRKNLFVVGDDDQAIYGFRGADIGNINRFCDDFKDCTIIRLEWNYRSVPEVLHFSNEIFTNKPLRLRKVLRAGNPRGSGGNPLFRENRNVEIWDSDNPVEEMVRIVARMKELREGYDLHWKDFAILVRYNRLRLYYEEALRDALIPVAGENGDSEGEVVEDGVHVETVHASKGLQYAVVFYAGLAEGLTPGECLGSHAERKKQLDEERRLFYVGVTRAEAYLILLYCRRRFWKGRLRNMRRSRFLPKQNKVDGFMKMPLLLFKIRAVAAALAYMFVHIPLFLFVLLFMKKDADRWLDYKIQSFSKFCMKFLRVNLTILDQANLAKVDWTRPVFVMGNHGSYADIPVAFIALERKTGFIAKSDLLRIPFLGFWMKRLGCIYVDRQKSGAAKSVHEAVKHNLQSAPLIFVFPEGTRSKTGKLSPFKSGGFRFSVETDAIVLPVVFKGTRQVWEGRVSSAPCDVNVRILEPIDVAALKKERGGVLDPKKDLMPMVRKVMEDNL